MKIYLDYAATTPTDKRVLQEMKPYFTEKFGNPHSLHSFGQEAQKAVDKSRKIIANFLNCSLNEIIFTSGATESNNFALKGVIKATPVKNPHIITTQIEHPSILKPSKSLEKQGVKITYLPPSPEGIMNKKVVQKAITDNTVLVSIMYANNEIGTIQPIQEIGEMIEKINSKREEEKRIIFHTDAVQAIGYLNCDIKKLKVDLLTASAHKIYGPKGIGFLFIKEGTKIERIQDGGEQERNLRSGTLNVPGIVGLGKAIELLQEPEHQEEIKRTKELRDYLVQEIIANISDVQINGSIKERLHNNINLSFKNVEGESILLNLDLEQIAVSTGSACASGSLEPSHVLKALGLPPEIAHSSIRFSLGRYTTKKEIDYLLSVLPKIINRLRKISPS